jgi:hypothetical protein
MPLTFLSNKHGPTQCHKQTKHATGLPSRLFAAAYGFPQRFFAWRIIAPQVFFAPNHCAVSASTATKLFEVLAGREG